MQIAEHSFLFFQRTSGHEFSPVEQTCAIAQNQSCRASPFRSFGGQFTRGEDDRRAAVFQHLLNRREIAETI
jgi:hypothetical protein